MSPLQVPDCQMVCPSCPNGADGSPPVVSFHHDQDQVRCPACRRWYRVVTRELAGPTQQLPLPEEGRSRYRVLTAEPGGRHLQRTFVGSPGLRLAIGARVSFVYQAGRLAGVANQTTGTWFALPRPRSARGARSLELGLLALAGALAVIIAVQVVGQAAERPALAAICALALVALAAPWLADLVAGDRGPDTGPPERGQKGSGQGL